MNASDVIAQLGVEGVVLGGGAVLVHHVASDGLEHLAVVRGELTRNEPVLVRVHHECLAGDLFVSTRCTCRRNMALALTRITEAGVGLLLYLRGTGTCTAPRALTNRNEVVEEMLRRLNVRAVRLLVDGDDEHDHSLAGSLRVAGVVPLHDDAPAGLTRREVEVLRLVAAGLVTKQIASRLAISHRTAYHHIEHIYAKIGVSTRAAAAAFAVEHGLNRSRAGRAAA